MLKLAFKWTKNRHRKIFERNTIWTDSKRIRLDTTLTSQYTYWYKDCKAWDFINLPLLF